MASSPKCPGNRPTASQHSCNRNCSIEPNRYRLKVKNLPVLPLASSTPACWRRHLWHLSPLWLLVDSLDFIPLSISRSLHRSFINLAGWLLYVLPFLPIGLVVFREKAPALLIGFVVARLSS
jgi:hypothetical protein